MSREAYPQLESRFARLSHVHGALQVLHWDNATMMPPGGAEARAEQIAALRLIAHELLTDPGLAALLDEGEADRDALDEWQRANIDAMRRRWRHASALPAPLVEAFSRATSACETEWRAARPADDWARIEPHLEEVVRLVGEVADAKAGAFGIAPYDALLDEYEPGLRAEAIDPLFDDLATFLPPFLDEVLARQAAEPAPIPLPGPFAVADQRKIGLDLMTMLGFDFGHGRLDESDHPFTGGVPEDVRLTTRYSEDDFSEALMGVLHETGHALYERGLPTAWRHQPVGEARGMALHESQSLIIEMQACRGAGFITHLAPLVKQAFGGSGEAWNADNLRRHYQRVERGLIRVNADEVTYPLHIILRFRLERAMLAGDLAVAELPGAWAEGMRDLLGLTPPDDRDGCMQDIHWMGGDFGYFPTYTLGAVAAAQLFDAARRAEPELLPALGRGDFAPLVTWLRENVHGYGSRYSSDALLRRATGGPLDAEVFKRHLAERYLGGNARLA